ncbi:MAG: ATP-binding cassette domain-containing protein [Aphanocapsa feldmannii 277cV]|uniref:ATP-binding cassette domain-containing protein n=2 Tax=Aphanocapsa feldmannii TaxID=192050 RepID=A0A524RQ03_9CHRO|nr:MAG: ATP-binding cassette domain-containing protein [Aphanocapsa feldmannii 288cV]TGG94400.1 MAG: ATP-binding cassette domain-containing protein [Aphanocapsa feldmannii 277cV]TGH27034.1 MAG: ATP-binding cassette domain-containing protein [Aphanocapsa feldmannii 277cI]
MPSPAAARPLLQLEGVGVGGHAGRPRLRPLSFSLHGGERVALIGASGAGKSSLISLLNGSLPPDMGRISWFGAAPQPGPPSPRQRRRIGTLWQDLRLLETLTVQQNLNAGCLPHWGLGRSLLNLLLPLDSEACRGVLRRVRLDPGCLALRPAQLSGGQRQRVALARLLRQDPDLWLADEPMASLDPTLVVDLLELLFERVTAERALLLSLHRPDLLAGFDRVLALREGELVFDGTAAQLDHPWLQRLYSR